jgi:predicted CXXCH cytochrome family protein
MKWTCFAACLLASALYLATGKVGAEDAPAPAIFRPTDKSVLPNGNLSFVARIVGSGKLLVDGKPAPAASPAPNALMATLKLTPGEHQLTLESNGTTQTVKVFVAGAGQPPAGFETFRAHPPGGASCETCHAVKEGKWAFKGVTSSASCIQCHDTSKFAESHTHPVDTLEDCHLCHMPHGSTKVKHLKFTREVACKQCHG